MLGCFFGLGFLKKVLRLENVLRLGPYHVWAGLFIVVTLQMSTALRPILGSAEPFLPTEKRFFLEHWGETLSQRKVLVLRELPQPEESVVAESTSTTARKATGRGTAEQNPYLTR